MTLCSRCNVAERDQKLAARFGRICRGCYRATERRYKAKARAEGRVRPSPESVARAQRKYRAKPSTKRVEATRKRAALRDPVQRPRILARAALKWAVRSGKIQRQPCSRCANPKADGHHTDYSRPLDVVWLCRACHITEHVRDLHGEGQP